MNLLRERQRLTGAHRACGDSDSSQTDAKQDRKVSGRDGAQVSGDGNTVMVTATDHGAVMAGAEATRGALDLARDTGRLSAALTLGVFDSATKAQGSAYQSALDAVGKAFETSKAGDQREVSMVAMAVVGVVAAVSLFGKGKV